MSQIFNDPGSMIVFFVGIVVSTIFLVGIWEFTRHSVTGSEGPISNKIKKKKVNDNAK